MKKLAFFLVIVIAVIATVACVNQPQSDYIRIHIRANSNSEYDQNIKYSVKDVVVEYITPLAPSITDKKEMYTILTNNLSGIKSYIDRHLSSLGQNYTCTVSLNQEDFPARTYEDLTLEAGIYDALIIELGAGVGDNWWCVAFPPLCFTGESNGSDDFVYKSLIVDWFK